MSLIVEDGSRVTGANTYADVATVDAYHLERGNATWTGTDAAKEAAILRAMTFLDSMNWHGYAANAGQSLEWPRTCMEDRNGRAIDSNVIPAPVVHALAELALRELASPGATLPDGGLSDGISGIEVAGAVKMQFAAKADARPDYRIVRALLKGLIHPAGSVRLMA